MDKIKEKNIYNILSEIQHELKAPKNQYNKFGKYNYRSCEDIMEGLKPLLKKHCVCIVVSDSMEIIGDRYYVKSTAKIFNNNESISTTGFAREPISKKGMDDSQITGSTSSYARKYALNGLLAIDDTKDSDFNNTGNNKEGKKQVSNDVNLTQLNKFIKSKIESGTDRNFILKELGIKSPEEINIFTTTEVKEAFDHLQSILK